MKDFYLCYKGKEIYFPIEQSTQMNGMNIFYKTTGDGKQLQITKKACRFKILIIPISYNVYYVKSDTPNNNFIFLSL